MDTQEMNISYDLGGMTVCDSSSVNPQNLGDLGSHLQDLGKENFMKLFRKYLSIKEGLEEANEALDETLQLHDFGKGEYEVRLPEKSTVVPRFKVLPSEKMLSKWQKFAKDKGIQKKKKSRMVYDETQEDYVPRWGAYSIKHNQRKAEAIVEVGRGEDPNKDVFEQKDLERSLAKQKQKLSTIKNQAVREGVTTFMKAPQEVNQVNKVDRKSKKIVKGKGKGKKDILLKQKNENNKILSVAQKSTASMGKHDKKSHKQEEKQKVAKRKIVPSYNNSKQEKSKSMDILAQIQKQGGLKQIPRQ